MTLLFLRQHLMRLGHQRRKAHPEDLPCSLQLQPDRRKPCVHICQQLPQLSLVGAEDGEVVHLPQIMDHAILLVVDHQIQRLKGQMQEPGGEECTDQHAVFHHGVAQPEGFLILEQPLQCVDDIDRIELLEAVVNIAFQRVFGAMRIILHPFLDGFHTVGITSARNTCDAVTVHSSHDVWDHDLQGRVVDALVRP